MQLLDTPANPIPPGAELRCVTTRDGVRLRVAAWPALPNGPGLGTVLILQGRAEFVEKYFEVVGELQARGFAVVAFDWRGQGRSDRSLPDRRRGHVRHFDDFRLDLEAVLEDLPARLRPGPLHGLAHSMGGCIALTGAAQGWLPVERLVVTNPMVALCLVRWPRLARGLAALLAGAGLGRHFVPGGQGHSISTLPFEGNRLCTDPGRYGRNALVANALEWVAIGAPTVGWLRAAYAAMDQVAAPGLARRIAMPVLVVAGGDDPICSTPAIERFARDLRHGTAVTVPGCRHEILMETDLLREVFWDSFDRFLASAASSTGRAEAQPPRIPTTVA